MTMLELAQECDKSNRPVEAAEAYEKAIAQEKVDLSVFLDLATLYFSLLDPGEVAHRGLGQDFLDKAWQRANDLLDQAEARFGPNSEVAFWRRYFAVVVLSEPPFVEECKQLLNAAESIVPFLYLYVSSDGREYQEKARALYEQVATGRTARERYIRSIVAREALG